MTRVAHALSQWYALTDINPKQWVYTDNALSCVLLYQFLYVYRLYFDFLECFNNLYLCCFMFIFVIKIVQLAAIVQSHFSISVCVKCYQSPSFMIFIKAACLLNCFCCHACYRNVWMIHVFYVYCLALFILSLH